MPCAYEITKLTDAHYRLEEDGVYMDLLIGADKALLIDTGLGFGDLPKAVRSITDKELIIFNTHGHHDHACGNWQFAEPAWIDPRDMELCRISNTPARRVRYSPEERPEDFRRHDYFRGGTGQLLPASVGQIFDLGGIRLEVVDLRGHTHGSLGLLDRAGRRLFVGDAMNRALFLFQKDVSEELSVYIDTLKRTMALPIDILWESHITAPEPVQALQVYLRCAQEANMADAYPCGEMLETEDVRLFVASAVRDRIDPDNFHHSIYECGLWRDPEFCSIYISQYTAP